MKFTQLETIFPALISARAALHIKSGPGLGKSEFVDQQIARHAERVGKPVGVAKLFVGTATPNDLLGYGIPRQVPGTNRTIMAFSEPVWLQSYDNPMESLHEFEHSFLILEEFGQGEGDVKKASADLFLNGRIGPHRLPKNCQVIALSNRQKDRSGVTKDFDFRINREQQIEIDPDLDGWIKWATSRGINPTFVGFAANNPQIVFDADVPEMQGPWCTPRSLVRLERVWSKMGGENGLPVFTREDGSSDPVAMEVAAGNIGDGAAAQLVATLMLAQEMPKFEEIVKSPLSAKCPERPDAQMLVNYNLAHRVDEDTLDPCIKYIERMPPEFIITFARAAVARNPMLVNTKAFGDCTRRNASLMMAVTG